MNEYLIFYFFNTDNRVLQSCFHNFLSQGGDKKYLC